MGSNILCASRNGRGAGRMGRRPLGVVGLLGTGELDAKLAEAVVVEAEEGLVGARRVVQVGLGGSATEDERSALGRDAPLGALLVPGETALAAVDELKRAGLEGGRDRGEGGVSGVGERHVVAGRVAERRVDGAVEGPGHQQEGLGHLTRRAVRDAAVARDIVVGNLAALKRCERGGGRRRARQPTSRPMYSVASFSRASEGSERPKVNGAALAPVADHVLKTMPVSASL